jgi:hypothetical protein
MVIRVSKAKTNMIVDKKKQLYLIEREEADR